MKAFTFLMLILSIGQSCAQNHVYKEQMTKIGLSMNEFPPGVTAQSFGNLYPINTRESLMNAGSVFLLIIDNETGIVEKRLDETALVQRLERIIDEQLGGKYALPQKEDYEDMPFCQLYPIRYERVLRLENEEGFVCEVSFLVREIENPETYTLVHTLGFFEEDLNLSDLIFVEGNDNGQALLLKGGFFKGKDTFWARKIAPFQGASDFVRYHNATGRKYENLGEETAIPMSSLAVYTPARFFSAFQLGGEYFVNTGTELVRTKDFTGPVERLPFPLEADECVDVFEKVHDNRFVGLNSKLDGKTASMFETDAGFKDFQLIKQYDFLRYTLRSIEVLDDTVYILLFDREQYSFLLERITLPPLGQPLLGR
jgi:hypothetical protein